VQDVSEQVVDLDSRISAATASVERVRGFLEQTANVGELAAVEAELTARETQLEGLVGQRRALADHVALATITARFGVEAAPAIAADPEVSDDIPGFLRALRHGWVVLVTVFQVLAAVVGFLLPFGVVAVPGYLLWRRWVQRRQAPASI